MAAKDKPFAWRLGELPAPFLFAAFFGSGEWSPSVTMALGVWVGVGHGHGPLSGAPVQDDIVSTTVFEIKAVTEPSQRSLWK